MKKAVAFTLLFLFLFSCLAIAPQQALADPWKNENGKWCPPGLLKKMSAAGYVLPPGIAKKYEEGLKKIFNVKSLTRAQVAYILAEINSEEYKGFDQTNEVLKNVADRWSIPIVYRKAVAFVISEDLMSYKTQSNGKIIFEPNKRVTWSEVYDIFINGDQVEPEEEETYTGTVRFIYKIGDKTWIAVETGGKLKTAYFEGTPPSNLATGIAIKVKAEIDSGKIIKSSLENLPDQLSNLVFSIKANQPTPEVGETLTFIPRLVNKSQNAISLEDVSYRFTIKRAGTEDKWEFTGSSAQDLTIPANNSSNPVALAAPTQDWTPPAAGEYILVKAQLRLGEGTWQNVSYEQQEEIQNLLTANQSNAENNTSGFASYGVNTFAGATLTRDSAEKWQGSYSLKVTTNGYSAWQGVNVNYQGAALSGDLTFSFYIKAPQGTPLRVKIYDNTNSNYPSGNALEFTASGNWERKSVTFTPSAGSGNLALQITLNNYDTATAYYIDGLQLEKGDEATAWVPGGTYRTAALVVAP